MACGNITQLNEEEWSNITEKLTVHATLLVKYVKRCIELEPDELALKAIGLVLEGRRKWNQNRFPDLLDFLKAVVRSLIRNELKSPEYIRRQSLLKTFAEENDIKDPFDDMKNRELDPLTALENNEIVIGMKQHLLKWAGDDDLIKLIIQRLFTFRRRGEIADELSLPMKKVDNIMKRIRRELRKFLDRH